jgi:hypothetical protein
MKDEDVVRDERTVATENMSYRWAYLILSYGLLLSTAYRAFARKEASWDLLGLVIVGGIVSSTYQGAHGILTKRWVRLNLLAMAVAAVVAVLIVLLMR